MPRGTPECGPVITESEVLTNPFLPVFKTGKEMPSTDGTENVSTHPGSSTDVRVIKYNDREFPYMLRQWHRGIRVLIENRDKVFHGENFGECDGAVNAPETLGFGNNFRRTETVADPYCLGDTESVPENKSIGNSFWRTRFWSPETVPETKGFWNSFGEVDTIPKMEEQFLCPRNLWFRERFREHRLSAWYLREHYQGPRNLGFSGVKASGRKFGCDALLEHLVEMEQCTMLMGERNHNDVTVTAAQRELI
ncbi:hypothetical protein DFH08DRAFT_825264 [Mycena albidolilacea]|uniref:Uncharacterized protein n=1 Tax=Mycena albidolilacea TaxID=1033008 RepID=A0AAD7EA95_9AGAR|nr:hypothetical protein DFH08DRAFT_825264 [Mycena albidolilacea]